MHAGSWSSYSTFMLCKHSLVAFFIFRLHISFDKFWKRSLTQLKQGLLEFVVIAVIKEAKLASPVGGVVYNIDLSMYQFDDQEMDDDTIYYKSDSGKEVLVEKLEGGNIIWYDADTDTECVLTLNENKTAYNMGTDCPLEWEVATIIMDEDGQPTGIEGPGGDIFKIDISQQAYEDVPSKFVAESGTEVVFESQGE